MSAGPGPSSSQQLRPVDFDPFAAGDTAVTLPLTPAQQEIWMASQMGADASAAYNQSFPLRLTGRLSLKSLRSALAALTDRHQALRVTFPADGSSQVVHPRVVIPLALIDLADRTPNDRGRLVDDLLTRAVREPFDLAMGPLVRVQLVREAADRHLMIFTAHHLICDGWSSGMLLRELGALYTADCHGLPARLAESMSYSDYVRAASVESPERAVSEQYWLDQFADRVPALDVPTDRPRATTRTFRGTHERITVAAALYDDLKRLGARHGCSLYVTLLAAWQVLLFRISRSTDFVIGIPVAGQSGLENPNLAGHFVHVLPLRTSIEASRSFTDQLLQTRRALGDAHEHSAISFGQLAPFKHGRHSVPGTSLAAVFNVDPPVDAPRFHGLEIERIVAPRSSFNFEIGLDIANTGSTLQIECSYNADLFEAASVGRWLDCYVTLLAAVASGDDSSLSRLPILSAEQQAVIRRQSGARTTFASKPVVQDFEKIAAATPDAIAVSFDGQVATYGELNRHANRLAHHLRRLGIDRDRRVAICLERSVDLVAAIVGVMKSGGAYVPIEPGCPHERMRSMIAQAEPRAIVTSESNRRHFASTNLPIVCLDSDREAIAGHGDSNPGVESDPADLAYVVFTSGSTGQPKGVAVTHGNLSRLFVSTEHWFQFGPADVWTLFHSCSFDFSVWELWGALRYGGRLVVVPHAISRSPDAFLELIDREGVTVLNQTPSAFRQLVEAERTMPAPLSELRCVIFGGEALDLPSLRGWIDRRGDAQPALINMYGITETTVHVTYRRIRSVDLAGGRIHIGVQLPDLELHLLDPSTLQPVPDGTIGEICVGGAGVARGYLNRPDLSASRFVPNMFADCAGSLLYRSGDLARRSHDGDLEYFGRVDDQVKIRGFRIELGEIEAQLTKHPAVRESVVLARDTGPGDMRLIAYLIPVEEETPAADALRDFLKCHLPDYMIPSAFVTLASFPLTQNGKIDRGRLKDAASPLADRGTSVAPRTDLERVIADQWCKVLRIDGAGIFDNFFEIGGHSLLAIQLMLRLEEVLGIRLPVLRLFETPTIAGIASEIAKSGGSRAEAPSPAIRRRSGDVSAPLSFGQQRLWFLNEFEPGASSYNITNAIRLSGPLDLESLRRAIETIVCRHEALRTTFAQVDGRPVQVVGAVPVKWPLPRIDLRGCPERARLPELQRFISDEAHRPFDLRSGPILRSTIIQSNDDEHVLVLAVHHIAYDGWSHAVFCRELGQLYGDYCAGRGNTLPPPAIQYGDYAAWQREYLRGEVLAGQIDYWRGKLHDPLPVLALPADRARPAMQTWRGALQRFHLTPDIVDGVRSLGRTENATLFMTLLALYQAFLHRYTAQDDIVVGTPVASRSRAETEDMIGFCVNTLAIRTDLTGEPTVRALVARVRDLTIEAMTHQDVPLEKLVEELHVERSLSHSPVFQTVFSLDEMSEMPSLAGLAGSALEVETGVAKFDLTWWATDRPDGLSCVFEYNTDLFDGETAARFADQFQRLVAAAVTSPDLAVAELPLLADAERQRIRSLGNHSIAGPRAVPRIHEMFEEQARRTPDAPAVVCEGRTLTYLQLNARANQIAQYLRQRGVGPENLVGLCFERSLEMIVCVLGVLKAGAAYVPFDPSYPADRLAFMLDDAQPGVLMTMEALVPRLRTARDRLVCLDRDAAAIDQQPVVMPAVAVPAEALAYVIYTSGSTGRPKGVAVTHANVSRLMESTRSWFAFGAADVWTLFHSYAFDFSVWEIWGALAYGGRLVIVPHWVSRSPDAFRRLLIEEQVTVLNQTPSAFRQLIQEDQRAHDRIASLRCVILGGEALELQSLAPWFARYGDEYPRVINMYGITETTVHVTYRPIDRSDVAERRGSVIGVPIPDLEVHLLDSRGHIVPLGVPGEIHVGGEGVARGYLNRPELTASRFVDHRFEDGTTSRLYRSGDLARRLPDGQLEYLGRADDQVKIRGFRLELSEIEGVLRGHAAVRDCAVLVNGVGDSERRLVAYVVLDGNDMSIESLKEYLRAELPDYMVPPAFVRVAVLPLSPNGKVDRRALPAPDESSFGSAATPVAPRTAAEKTIASIWAKALGRERVSVHDNFFAIGGHSLMAAEVVAGLRMAFGIDIPLVALFKAPTVAELAQAVEPLRWAGGDATVGLAGGIREEIEL